VNSSDKKISRKSRNSWRLSGVVNAEGMVTKSTNRRSPAIKYKRSKNDFAVTSFALSLGNLGARLLELPAKSLIRCPGTRPTMEKTHSDRPRTADM